MKCPLRTSQSGYAMQECERACAWYVDGECAVARISKMKARKLGRIAYVGYDEEEDEQ